MTKQIHIHEGDRVSAHVAVTAADGSTPLGAVQFTVTTFGVLIRILDSGQSDLPLAGLSPGEYTVQASFPSQGHYAASVSDELQVDIEPDKP